ncbi:MAG: glycosylhydrolase-like jelly roll fold domain-containing protein [Phycisphaerae bacterium]
MPETLKVHGPWKIAFTPGWGAPSNATFNKLISWTHSHRSGIKYFSGTGTYRRTIDLPHSYFGADKRVILHLGQVNDLAQVWVNGHDLGVLWHPPFRVDITSAIQPGHNVLRIAVTNTWQNRLIGDDQQPSDLQWGSPLRSAAHGYIGRPLIRFPSWVIHNAPRPSKKCYTFETWNFYRKDSRLHQSGLLGPVKLTVEAKLTVPMKKNEHGK